MTEQEKTHELIVVITNQGYTDQVMDAARAAGATGGTAVHAKGTGTELAKRFFGVSIASERELIFILARVAGSLFVRLFTTEPSLAAEALDAIRVCTLAIIPLGVQYALVDGFTGMGQVQLSLPLSTFRKAVYFAALFLLPGMYGARAAFYAEPVSDILGPIVSIAVYALFIRRVLHFSQPERTENGPVLP